MRYVAFLRAINVGGHTVKMDRLRALFEEMGFANVETFIASGNVLFDSKAGPEALEKKIEQYLARALGYDVATFVRPVQSVTDVIDAHPFASKLEKAHNLYVGFLKAAPSKAQKEKIASLACAEHEFHLGDRELYWLSHISMADTKISNATLEKAVGASTFRSISSLEKLAKKAGLTA